MNKEKMLEVLKEIQEGKDGQLIPYHIIFYGIQPLIERACLPAAIYLIEHIKDK